MPAFRRPATITGAQGEGDLGLRVGSFPDFWDGQIKHPVKHGDVPWTHEACQSGGVLLTLGVTALQGLDHDAHQLGSHTPPFFVTGWT